MRVIFRTDAGLFPS
ncbi:hypothetical protein ECNE098_4388, partial [Escherichia coli NE098]